MTMSPLCKGPEGLTDAQVRQWRNQERLLGHYGRCEQRSLTAAAAAGAGRRNHYDWMDGDVQRYRARFNAAPDCYTDRM